MPRNPTLSLRSLCAASVAVPVIATGFATTAVAAPSSLTPVAKPTVEVAAAVKSSAWALKASARPGGLPAAAKGRYVSTSRVTVSNDVNLLAVTWPNTRAAVSVFVRTTAAGKTSPWQQLAKEVSGEKSTALGTEPTMVSGSGVVEAVSVASAPVATSLRSYGSEATTADAATASAAAQTSGDAAALNGVSMNGVSMNGVSMNKTARSGVSMNGVSMNAASAQGSVTGSAVRRVYKPSIRTRAAWRANQKLVTKPYSYSKVTGVMIHHTATTNSYTRAQVPAILRSIQAYHVKGRGWIDIAYNVVVDKYGVAWEGRGGGLTNAVTGGHAMGVTNSRTFGLSFLGNYQVKKPSAAMLDQAERVIAWKFAMHNVKVYGRTWGSAGTLAAVSGHRNEKSTSCPGKYVYSKMGQIRAKVATYKKRYYTGLSPAAVRAATR